MSDLIAKVFLRIRDSMARILSEERKTGKLKHDQYKKKAILGS